MLESFLQSYLIFLAKSITVVLALLLIITILLSAVRQLNSIRAPEHLDIRNLNDRFRDLADASAELLRGEMRLVGPRPAHRPVCLRRHAAPAGARRRR